MALDQTLKDLRLHRYSIGSETRTGEVARTLHETPTLPGALVRDGDQVLGLLARDRFLDHLSRPLAVDLFQHRPIRAMSDAIDPQPLTLRADVTVHEAAALALQRPPAHVYEPIVVVLGAERLRLLDMHTLLVAQSRLASAAHDEVQRQRDAAEAANVAKSAFLANMSHEIRTPLTAVLGYAENLLDPRLDGSERRDATLTILRNGRHLLEIINDILDLSKIEAGRMEVEHLDVEVIPLALDCAEVMRVRADSKALPLRVDCRTPTPRCIVADPTRLRQVLMNLLGNAIKFTDAGEVRLSISAQRADGEPVRSAEQASRFDEGWMLRFDVIDTGIGMTDEQQAGLFNAFSQADSTVARRFGGTGLGLTISRRLAELMGGTIELRSVVGEGSTFSLVLPVGRPGASEWIERLGPCHAEQPVTPGESQDAPIDRLPISILLAEDGPDNQRLIGRFLERQGARVAIASNGEEALLLADAARRGERDPFDLILMDMHMPTLDGYAATRRLRRSGYNGPILALTAAAMDGDREKCLAAGCDDYAIKPIDRRRLARQIADAAQLGVGGRMAKAESDQGVGLMSRQRGDERDGPDETDAKAPAGLTAAGSGSAAGPGSADGALDPATVDPAIVDFDQARRRAGGDATLLAEIVDLVLECGPPWVTELAAAAATDDLEELTRLAHTLKNSADNVGAGLLQHEAAALEALCHRDDVTRESRLEAVQQVERAWATLHPWLSAWASPQTATRGPGV